MFKDGRSERMMLNHRKEGVVGNVKPEPLDNQTGAEALNLWDPVRREMTLRGSERDVN